MATAKVKKAPLVVIVGPTASGKTALAVELAEHFGGEIICADSRTVYRGMDIGTAKPTKEEQARVPHWGLNLVDPGQSFTVANFKQYADSKIADIRVRGKIPFLVGGSGLYIDAVVFNYQFGEAANPMKRSKLEGKSLQELHDYCKKHNIKLPENSMNKRYVVRAIERHGQTPKRLEVPESTSIIVGIATDKTTLRQRINQRSEQIFSQGVVEEAIILGKKYGWNSEAMTGNVYPLVYSYLQGDAGLKEVSEKFSILDWRLAKRQLTWFRSNPYIIWQSWHDASSYIKSTLATD